MFLKCWWLISRAEPAVDKLQVFKVLINGVKHSATLPLYLSKLEMVV